MLTGYEFLEAAYMAKMMSGGGNDRLEKLMKSPILSGGYICGDWHYYVKASLDIDACDQIFWNGEYIKVQRNYWILYMCVYHGDNFQFAIPAYTGIEGHSDQYAIGDYSGKLDSTIDCSKIIVQSRNMSNDCSFSFQLLAPQIYCTYNVGTGEVMDRITSTRSGYCNVRSLLSGTSAGQEATPIIGKGIIYIESVKKLRKDWYATQSKEE